jgi:hypothetical protein
MTNLDNKLIDRIDALLGGEIKALPQYPYNPEVGKAIVELEKLAGKTLWSETIERTATLYIEHYRQQQQSDYIAQLQGRWEGRKIGLEDVLRAIGKTETRYCSVSSNDGIIAIISFISRDDNLIVGECEWKLGKNLYEQTEPTKQSVAEILGVR